MTIIVSESGQTTAIKIIERAMRSINALGAGEALGPDDARDALDALNDVLEGWSNERLTIYQITQEGFALTPGQATYSIGTNGDFNTPRPMRITSAFLRWNGADYPVDLITQEEYDSIALKAAQSNLPSVLYVDTGYPLSTVKLWSVPNVAATLYLNSLKPLAAFGALTDAVSFPPGYARALRYALALELMPEYGANNPLIIARAANAKRWIKRANFQPDVLRIDGSRGSFNIYTGE
jgi:hypothetical protein